MPIDISKIKPGDKVTLVPLEVVETPIGSSSIGLRLSRSGVIYVVPDQLAAHHPAPREIGVGDRVWDQGRVYAGTVEHVSRGMAWVAYANADCIRFVSDLTLVEGDQ